jgi:hypothetical protein
MINYDIVKWGYEIIQIVAYDYYDGFQHLTIIYSQKFISLL